MKHCDLCLIKGKGTPTVEAWPCGYNMKKEITIDQPLKYASMNSRIITPIPHCFFSFFSQYFPLFIRFIFSIS